LGMQVLVRKGREWARKCCPKGIFYASSTGTLTCVKSLVMMFKSIVPPYLNVSQ
jgi:hypothetical protein